MTAPKDPMSSRASYANRGAEPVMKTGPKGPQAKGTPYVDRSHCGSYGQPAAGPMKPKASSK